MTSVAKPQSVRALLLIENRELRMMTPAQRARRAQRLVRKYIPDGVSLADELIAERRREAAASKR